VTLSINDIQHNDAQHIGVTCDTQHKRHSAQRCSAIMLNVVMLSVTFFIAMLNVVTLSFVMLSVIMLRVVMPSVIMLSVVAPLVRIRIYCKCEIRLKMDRPLV
jgi:hypothetical protein